MTELLNTHTLDNEERMRVARALVRASDVCDVVTARESRAWLAHHGAAEPGPTLGDALLDLESRRESRRYLDEQRAHVELTLDFQRAVGRGHWKTAVVLARELAGMAAISGGGRAAA